MIGYDVESEERSFEQEGITGTVTRYARGVLTYPCYIVYPPFETYKLRVLQTMYLRSDSLNNDDADLGISVYFKQGERLAGLGKIYPRQVSAFLKLFEKNRVVGYYDENTELTGDYLYVLGG